MARERSPHIHAGAPLRVEREKEDLHQGGPFFFRSLAAVADLASAQGEVEAIVDLLEPADRPGWFRWLFLHHSRHKLRNAYHRWFLYNDHEPQ